MIRLPAGEVVEVLVGEVRWGAPPLQFGTILGSCVAVCLWDARQRCGGMNHFLTPADPRGARTARSGDAAMAALLDGLTGIGVRPAMLRAKVFGGAEVLPMGRFGTSVGAANVRVALGFLQAHRIPVVARRTGGHHGIRIRFDTASGDVLLLPILGPKASGHPESRLPVAG